MLKDEAGNWMEDRDQLKNLAVEYYAKIFGSNKTSPPDFITGSFLATDMQHSENWTTDCSIDETKRALKEMGPWKAPGPDGFQPGFYKKTWTTTGVALHNFIKETLQGKEVPDDALSALLVLIPKVAAPSCLKQFRPISLCNVSVKLVTKVIANRLKLYLKDLIAPNQSSFVPGRQSLDNAIVCQEILHLLRYTQSRKGG